MKPIGIEKNNFETFTTFNIANAKTLSNSKDTRALKEACKGVEALFLNMMIKEMRKTIPKSGLLPDSLAKDIYTSLFDQHISQELAKSGRGIGLAEMLFENLSQK